MIIQSTIFSKYLSDEGMRSNVGDHALIKNIILFEKSLAKAQSKLGIIPAGVAQEIQEKLEKIAIIPENLVIGTLENGIPVITILEILKTKLSVEAQNYIHHGATSQDAMDTALVMIIRDALKIISEKINVLIQNFESLKKSYGDTPCMARTRGQLALPITFGMKINAWEQPLRRQLTRLSEFFPRLLKVQIGGPVGNFSLNIDNGQELVQQLAAELNLSAGDPWQNQRDNICELGNWLAMLTNITGKMGADIMVMAQNEISEVEEKGTGGGRSSSMPHKNNPVLSEALVALAKFNVNLQLQLLQSMSHQNERDGTALVLEWNTIPQMIVNASAALNHASTIGTNIKVNTEIMKENVARFRNGT
jgi:3-carboxy-cis,cis-muconate cycloisomerase